MMLLAYVGCVAVFVAWLAYKCPNAAEPGCMVHWPLASAALGEDIGTLGARHSDAAQVPTLIFMDDDGRLHILLLAPDPILNRDEPEGDDSQPLEHCSLPPATPDKI